MPDIVLRLPALVTGCCFAATVALVDVSAARAAKLKMVFPGPVTTFSLPYLVAQKKGWMSGLDVEDVHVTGDANAMRVLLSGNADIGLIGTLNVLASIHAGASIRAIHSWQPIGDYSLVLAKGRATSSPISRARSSPRRDPAGCRISCRGWSCASTASTRRPRASSRSAAMPPVCRR